MSSGLSRVVQHRAPRNHPRAQAPQQFLTLLGSPRRLSHRFGDLRSNQFLLPFNAAEKKKHGKSKFLLVYLHSFQAFGPQLLLEKTCHHLLPGAEGATPQDLETKNWAQDLDVGIQSNSKTPMYWVRKTSKNNIQ